MRANLLGQFLGILIERLGQFLDGLVPADAFVAVGAVAFGAADILILFALIDDEVIAVDGNG